VRLNLIEINQSVEQPSNTVSHILYDESQEVAKAYDASLYPEFLLIPDDDFKIKCIEVSLTTPALAMEPRWMEQN